MDYIMETVGLRKAYKGNIVVDNVNIHIPKGAIYGFVGPKRCRKKHGYENDFEPYPVRCRRGSAFGRKSYRSQLRNFQKRLALSLRTHTFTIK